MLLWAYVPLSNTAEWQNTHLSYVKIVWTPFSPHCGCCLQDSRVELQSERSLDIPKVFYWYSQYSSRYKNRICGYWKWMDGLQKHTGSSTILQVQYVLPISLNYFIFCSEKSFFHSSLWQLALCPWALAAVTIEKQPVIGEIKSVANSICFVVSVGNTAP